MARRRPTAAIVERLMSTPVHIHCHAADGERQHMLTTGCWCHPFTLRLSDGIVVVDHNGGVRPSVLVEPKLDLGVGSRADGLATRTGRFIGSRGTAAPRTNGVV